MPLEINAVISIDGQTVTAFFVGIVALVTTYQAYQGHQAAGKVEEVKQVLDETHKIVNSQRTAMEALIKKLEGENAELRRDN